MSFLCFKQNQTTFRGLFVFDADPSWELEDVRSHDGLLAPRCRTDEGDGTWVVFRRDEGVWGAVLRRDDAPYNDCLPPIETYLLDGFKEQRDARAILESVRERTDGEFHNPFHLMVGDRPRNRLFLLRASFESTLVELSPGIHILEDNRDPDDPSTEDLEGFLNDLPSQDALHSLVLNEDPAGGVVLSRESGYRHTRAAVLFRETDAGLELTSCLGYPPRADWNRRIEEPQPS